MTKGQENFVDQMTRKLLVGWCDEAVVTGDGCSAPTGDEIRPVFVRATPYREFALKKKWISLSDEPRNMYKILSGGWDTATRFLKR